jgi:glycosyltransferase involved in cell wall biosynthesis
VSPPGVAIESVIQSKYGEQKTDSRWKGVTRWIPELAFELLEMFYNIWAFFRIRKEWRSRRFDLIFERYHFLGVAGLLTAKIQKVKFFVEVNFLSDTLLVRNRTKIIKPLERLIERFVLKNADGVIVVSSYLKTQAMENGVPSERLLLLPNAADPTAFKPSIECSFLKRKIGLGNERIVGFIGFFYPWHGIELLIDTVPLVSRKTDNFKFILVGDGPTFRKVRQKVLESEFPDKVLFIGRVDHGVVPKYISLFDIAVMPHSNNYGSPMKVLEYMAMAKAIIAPRLGPLEDIITDKFNGLLFEPLNHQELAEMIAYLLINENERQQIGKSARLTILEKNNWDLNAGNIISLYKRISSERL